jgi:hypothetical protein
MTSGARMKIAVVGSGISGLAAAWLLNRDHEVALYEQARRVGGHSNTVPVEIEGASVPVDTGFIVFNPSTYPNFVELLRVLGVKSREADMSLAVSLDGGGVEYSGSGLTGLFAQPSNLVRPRFWRMLADLVRFYRRATRDARNPAEDDLTLGVYLAQGGYGAAFRNHHILPMASAIWSAAPAAILDYPAAAFLRFHDNHGLLRLTGRPIWRTVVGGSQAYVSQMIAPMGDRLRLGAGVERIERVNGRVVVTDRRGERDIFDHVVVAAHADDALTMLVDADPSERASLAAFRYSRNIAVLHTDESLMPRRRSVWSSWNFIGDSAAPERASVTYWMNRLQSLPTKTNIFVTLNPTREPRAGSVLCRESYDHPLFDAAAIGAQKRLWSLQGARGAWFCGAHFGAGFHEDGLQAGLAVAEQLGGVRRPWRVANESSRIALTPVALAPKAAELAA